MTSKEENPYLKQVSGTHYMYMKIQPAEFINKNKLLFAEGSAIKYICRHSQKGGIADIDKAIHYLEMIKERDYGTE
tara:strand:+ start:225 stop:452 length:228 start_codon:yes stop_codon:yes gene_type:complete